MHPSKVDRSRLAKLTDLPNIGKAMEADLHLLGIMLPDDLLGQSPFAMFDQLCLKTGLRQDPCVLDVFISIVRFMEGDPAQPWWTYTVMRKATTRLAYSNAR